ncbi:ABC transporter substrate-binding protein [Agrobacterium tumefaciens]|uniref:ABC transporter substrate-binding protein n=1 Tax=Agrobacterium tumefaciens TaxID=358 RepID=UPI001573CBCB|nr:ABC transporter substrate-binding protein [Agrobacterium tumefaciens]NTC82583.1 ABC transporter substrate-binding protein [Agrobacterium tumefaciens]NTD11406.1 ABC transporter substrate-binding protein [Agrobacterium tumefaciens]NTD86727.1 ABC transporter substrate-binding protein [Agrobacterium tumefaciens]NTD91454.1 ABC transporter substrate-binding protein [Agrobacterium tumefaciens]NTD96925.1 ABC transporter substrate-binding protein [Agrobacterium tumefaciens]
MRKSKFGIITGIALLATAAAVQAEDIVIGAVLSATGPASLLGDPQKKTLEMLVEKINSEGGVKGQKLKLVVLDDGGDANQARTFATRMVDEDGVKLIIGGTTTGTTMAIMPIVADAEIPFVSFAGARQIIDPVQKWVFKIPHTDTMACEKIFQDIKQRGLSRVALISGTDGFGKSMQDQCVAVAQSSGIEIIRKETFGPRDADMTPQMTNIKNDAKVEAIVVPGIGQGPAIVVRNYQQLSVKKPLYVSHGVASKEFISLAGAGANGVRLPAAALLLEEKLSADDPQRPAVMNYSTLYKTKAKEAVSGFGGFAYDGFMIVVEALKRAKSNEPAEIRDAIEATKGYVGVNGVFNLSATDHMGLDLSGFRMVEIKDNDWLAVAR